MKIAVMAAGGVGGYFGARLQAAGHDVAFLARGAHLAAIRAHGLRINSDIGDLHLTDVMATDDSRDIGPVDIVMFAVKLWDTDASAEACRPLLGPDTAVIPFQNGVESIDTLARVLGPAHGCGGIARISAVIAEPGVIRQMGNFASLQFGEADDRRSSRMDAFSAACERAGFPGEIVDNVRHALWEKFIFLVALSGITAATRCAIGPIRDDVDGARMLRAVIEENAAVGRAMGVDMNPSVVERAWTFGQKVPHDMKASMLADLENGRRLEAPWLSGAVSRMGRELGVPTPVNDTLYAVVKPFEMGNEGRVATT